MCCARCAIPNTFYAWMNTSWICGGNWSVFHLYNNTTTALGLATGNGCNDEYTFFLSFVLYFSYRIQNVDSGVISETRIYYSTEAVEVVMISNNKLFLFFFSFFNQDRGDAIFRVTSWCCSSLCIFLSGIQDSSFCGLKLSLLSSYVSNWVSLFRGGEMISDPGIQK